MLWANFLHFYQPPTQKRVWVDRITTEAYRPVLKGLLDHPSARITFNINGVLLDLWEEFGHKDVIEMVGQLLDKKQIELTGSAKYHPLLPKIREGDGLFLDHRRGIELSREGPVRPDLPGAGNRSHPILPGARDLLQDSLRPAGNGEALFRCAGGPVAKERISFNRNGRGDFWSSSPRNGSGVDGASLPRIRPDRSHL